MNINKNYVVRKNSEDMEKIKDDNIQIRINSFDKKVMKRIAKERFKTLSEYILYLVMKDISEQEKNKLKK